MGAYRCAYTAIKVYKGYNMYLHTCDGGAGNLLRVDRYGATGRRVFNTVRPICNLFQKVETRDGRFLERVRVQWARAEVDPGYL